MTDAVELVLDAHADLGEGPLWDAERGVLVWVDIMRGELHTFDPASGRDSQIAVGQPVSAAAPRAGGGLVLALRDGFALLDPGSEQPRLVVPVEAGDRTLRLNDGKCDPAGRFLAGSLSMDDVREAGAFYRLDPDRSVTRLFDRVSTSNGLGWSADGRTLYYIDSPTQRVDAFDYDAASGTVANRRPLVEIAAEDGMPDGLAVDADGYLWVALWAGWSVRRYAPDGTLDRVLELPVSRVTSCAFGGPGLDELYVTSGSGALSAEEREREPHAGGLFRARPGVRGRAPFRFAG